VAPHNKLKNRILAQLPAHEFDAIAASLTDVALEQETVLYPPDGPIHRVYFPLSGMVSLLSITQGGDAIETGIVGSDGIVGGSCAIDGELSFGQATVQLDAVALKMDASAFKVAYGAHEHLRSLVNKYQMVLLMQAQQNAACHALHTVNSRLCRWLLQSQDMVGSDKLHLTQEFLSHMLGVRRNTVSVEAHILQNAGLVRYSRGHITILDRPGIEQCACECYAVIRARTDQSMGSNRP
jgi:CRP-like cAMP-binding protein